MLTLKKGINGNDYNYYTIKTSEGSFTISFENNLDLYWCFSPGCNFLDSNESYKLTITKENYEIYKEFDKLYVAIKSKMPFLYTANDDGYNHKIFDIDKYTDEKLIKNKVIDWYSDDFPYECASHVTIIKQKDCFEITFYKSHDEESIIDTFNIRFRNSGSRYKPYNVLFMDMYHDFENYNDEYHQMHIEEYMYSKKLKK